MSLDQNLFTLVFTQNKDYPDVTDLVDPSGTIHYHKRRVAGSEYKLEVFDPLSESLLITATAPNASAKIKTLELHNPTSIVELKSTGTLSFKWTFRWEEHDFEWKRAECFLVRKPDPPVLVAVTKEPTGRLKTQQVQILDYNINRFEINDRKGLEIVMLTALMTFHDSNDTFHEPSQAASPTSQTPAVARRTSVIPMPSIGFGTRGDAPPPPPPKPAPKTGVDRIAEMQAQNGDYNEVVVEEEGSVNDWAAYCNKLLQDDAMLFVTVKSSSAETVPKVLQVVEETRRIRYKAGLDDEELYQYVLHDFEEKKKGPKRINLNDDAEQKAKYKPPSSLMIHLSKIDMPELQPKSQPSTSKGKGKGKSDVKAQQPTHPAPPVLEPKPQKPSNPPPLNVPSAPSSPGPTQKQKKNKLSRPPREDERRQFYAQPTPSPGTGSLNAVPAPPTPPGAYPNRPPIHPEPRNLHSSFTPPISPGPNPPAYSYNQPNPKPFAAPPPPPSGFPGQYPQQPAWNDGRQSKTAAVTSMATTAAQTLASGLYDKLNKRK